MSAEILGQLRIQHEFSIADVLTQNEHEDCQHIAVALDRLACQLVVLLRPQVQVLTALETNPGERALQLLTDQAVGMENRHPTVLAEFLEGAAEQLPLRGLVHPCSVYLRFGHFKNQYRQHFADHAAERDGSQIVSDHV